MRRQKVLFGYDRIEIGERDWLICGLLWVGIGTLALGPFGVAAGVVRGLFALMLIVHTIEALYTAIRALTLEAHFRKGPHPRLVQ